MDQCVAIVKASVQRKSDCAGGEEEWEVEGERLCGEKKNKRRDEEGIGRLAGVSSFSVVRMNNGL